MKRYLNLMTLFLAFSTIASAQEGSFVEVSAARVTKSFVAPYQTGKYQIEIFTIDKEMALRPVKGYKLWVNPKTRRFRVTPATFKYVNELDPGNNFDVEPVPGGLMWCMCDSASDDCDIQVLATGGSLNYGCLGDNCPCLKFFECDTEEISSYETPGGNWFSF